MSLDNLSPIFRCFARVLSSISIRKSYQEALNHIVWKKVVEEGHGRINACSSRQRYMGTH